MIEQTCSLCGARPTQLYPAGWRCAAHTPARLAGRDEPPAQSVASQPLPEAAHQRLLDAAVERQARRDAARAARLRDERRREKYH